MKIAFIVDKCSPRFTGGYESRVLNLAKQLARRHEVRVFTSLEGDTAQHDGIQFVRSNLPTSRSVNQFDRSLAHSAAFAIQLLKSPFGSWAPDIVIVESIPFLQLATMGRWIRKLRSVVLLNVNEAWFDYAYFRGLLAIPSRLAVRHLLRTGLEFADRVMTISWTTARSLKSNYGMSDVSVVPMGLEAPNLPPSGIPEMTSRQFDFVTVGRIVSIKRQSDFVEALALLKQRTGWEGQAAVVGEGPMRKQLIELTRSRGLSTQVRFTGYLDEDAKFRTLLDSKTFVLCSEREGFSLATLEAQACGLAAVVAEPANADVFGASDLVTDGVTGITYPLGNVSFLADRLAHLLKDTELHQRVASTGLQQSSTYSWDRIVSTLESELFRLINTGATPAP